MLLVIRIAGQVDLDANVKETLHRLRIRRKYAATLLENTPEHQKLLRKVRNFVAYGTADATLVKELVEKRGQALPGKKISVEGLEKKGFAACGLKGFFRLHPPRGGIDAKMHVGVTKKAVLGDHGEKIGELVRRML